MSIMTVTPYFSKGDRYPCLIGVKAEGDEYELAYVSKQQLIKMDERHRSETNELRELAALGWEWTHVCCGDSCRMRTEGCGYGIDRECNYEREIADRMRELGIEVYG